MLTVRNGRYALRMCIRHVIIHTVRLEAHSPELSRHGTVHLVQAIPARYKGSTK
jgi:hypothetical protein